MRKHFLPDPFHPLGTYRRPARVQAHTRAFLVLSHAEVESYLEEWAKDVMRASQDAWTTSRRITAPLAYLLSSSDSRLRIPGTFAEVRSSDTHDRLVETCTKLFQTYYEMIGANHGVKERNLLDLFGPLGVPEHALGTTLLPNLEDFGKRRGVHAHRSVRSVASTLDPETEHKRVVELLTDLLPLDGWLVACKRRLR